MSALSDCIDKMVPPGAHRPGKYREGVIQVHVTRACDLSCYNCTQGSNLGGKPVMITPENFEIAVKSLVGYFGVVGIFGGNPALHPQFPELCEILKAHIPWEQRGLWCNNPNGHGKLMRKTFNPAVSNINVHLRKEAHDEFKRDWPESIVVGLKGDSRHSPVHLAMRDLEEFKEAPESMYSYIADCDINKHWSAMVCQVKGKAQAYFCEVAAAQAMLHESDVTRTWPNLGLDPAADYYIEDPANPDRSVVGRWWELGMRSFKKQVEHYCTRCAVPLRGKGELSQNPDGLEQTSETHAGIYKPKQKGRDVQAVTSLTQLGLGRITKVVDYLGNGKRV